MGCCFSSSASISPPTAVVIAIDGALTEHIVPTTVSKVLGADHLTCALCNSDFLAFDACIPCLHSNDVLRQDEIYFVIPRNKLGRPLSGADMATMAVKATSAMARRWKQRRRFSVAPVERGGEYFRVDDQTTISAGHGNVMMRQSSVKEKTASWAKALRRSLKRTLSMIHEEEED